MGGGGAQTCICTDALLRKIMEKDGLKRNRTVDRLHVPFCSI